MGQKIRKKIPNWRKIQVLQFYRHCLQLGLARISQATNECMDEYGHWSHSHIKYNLISYLIAVARQYFTSTLQFTLLQL